MSYGKREKEELKWLKVNSDGSKRAPGMLPLSVQYISSFGEKMTKYVGAANVGVGTPSLENPGSATGE